MRHMISSVPRCKDSWRDVFSIEGKWYGWPMRTVRVGRRHFLHIAEAISVPINATGTMGAPLLTARNEAPSLAGIMAPVGLRVPSGARPKRRPFLSACKALRKACISTSSRFNQMPPAQLIMKAKKAFFLCLSATQPVISARLAATKPKRGSNKAR